MGILTQPQARIPIGWATVAGQRVAVEIDPEWMRYLSTLTERSGGITGVSTTELTEMAFDDAGVEESKAMLYAMADSAGQVPAIVSQQLEDVLTDLADTRAQVAELAKTIQDMKQGLAA